MSNSIVYYVVKKDDGFIDHDNHSGGYPYKTDFKSAKKHSTMNSAMESKRLDNGTGILRCTVIAEEVSQDVIDEELRQSALKKLSPQEIKALGLGK